MRTACVSHFFQIAAEAAPSRRTSWIASPRCERGARIAVAENLRRVFLGVTHEDK